MKFAGKVLAKAYERGEIKKDQKQINDFEAALELLPATKIENYMYQNKGDLKFEKVTQQWKMN